MKADNFVTFDFQTLLAAWEDGSLAVHYLSKWLKSTDHQLKSLEQAAAPEHWSCHWDRYAIQQYIAIKTNQKFKYNILLVFIL